MNGWTPDEHRVDRSWAALTNLADYLINLKKDDQAQKAGAMAEGAWKILERSLDTSIADVAAAAAAKLHINKLGRHGTPANTATAAGEVILRLTKLGYTALAGA